MFVIDSQHYNALMQNINFTKKHQPQFLDEFDKVYRNNMHLAPFFTDIKAFADNPNNPEIIIIKKGTNLLLSANTACDTYDNMLREFLTGCFCEGNEALWLHLSTESLKTKINVIFSDHNREDLNRYNFRLNIESFKKLPNWRTQIPNGFSIEYFDAYSIDFRKKHGKTDEAFFPESKRFAFVAIFEDTIISECFSVIVDDNIVEIGIHTYDERFKKRGLAFLTSAAFIEYCINNNLETNWGCDCNNFASVSLAKKLGYELLNEDTGIKIYGK